MNANISHHIKRYGEDFLKKLPHYRTATWNGRHVGIGTVNMTTLMACVHFISTPPDSPVEDPEAEVHWVSVAELDDFVL